MIRARYDSTCGGVNKDTLGGGKGKGEKAPAVGAEASDHPITCSDEDAIDTSETLTGKRGWTPAEGVMDSDVPTQSVDKRIMLGDLHLAFVTDKDVVKERAQWRRSDMKDKIDTQTRMERKSAVAVWGGN